jgi:predicted PurR-regulated permease PerM
LALVFTLVGRPLVRRLLLIRLGNRPFPIGAAAALTLLTIYLMLGLWLALFIPLLVEELQLLASIEPDNVVSFVQKLIQDYETVLSRMGIDLKNDRFVEEYLQSTLGQVFDSRVLGNALAIVSGFGDVVVALFSSSFIAFFLLQDPTLAIRPLLWLSPVSRRPNVERALANSTNLLRRYMLGLFIQSTIITAVVFTALSLLGIKNAFLMAAFAGATNIVPYVGPLMGQAFAVLIGVSTALQSGQQTGLLTLALTIEFTLVAVNVLDSIILQPAIHSNSVKAHPLEIFLVVLAGARVYGIGGMLLAVPVYTVIRVLSAEFREDFGRLRRWLTD